MLPGSEKRKNEENKGRFYLLGFRKQNRNQEATQKNTQEKPVIVGEKG